jgi:hypothetical protein
MSKLTWDSVGERLYETGTDHGVLYIPDAQGNYTYGVAWNGLTALTESPSGAESNKQYADNGIYLNLISAEEFSATLEAFTFPDEFAPFDGQAIPTPGVSIGQQSRRMFGLSYRTLLGNDLVGTDHGYKLHLVYGCQAAPSEKSYATVNESPEAITFSWEISTTPVAVGPGFKPTATLTIDSTRVDPVVLAEFEDMLYGTSTSDPILPPPATVIAMFSGAVTTVTPTVPTFTGGVLTIPAVTGVTYTVNSVVTEAGAYTITEDSLVSATPQSGYVFPTGIDTDWMYPV